MITSLPFPSSSSSLLIEASEISRSRAASTICNAQRSNAYIPKLEPFSRSKIDRGVKEPSFLQKSETELADYCSTLEGDDSYSCWKAYFELKDLERESSKDEIENLIRQSGGVKSLIGCLHGISAFRKMRNKDLENHKPSNMEKQSERPFPIPDGLPKSQEEIEEEEKGRMPDSPFTRLLRSKGKHPAWYSPAPDHETD
ncbi:CCG-binding protein 1 [Magnolia sinica]|uniref:CCG-binding protein 1 n=1 Tax=Magnolia sinica TaxID=86752 RepID=UPI0026582BE6|nr:CCG-binding protein 1 [Magnolia sinica]